MSRQNGVAMYTRFNERAKVGEPYIPLARCEICYRTVAHRHNDKRTRPPLAQISDMGSGLLGRAFGGVQGAVAQWYCGTMTR